MQQSRFLALVSDYDGLKEAMATAANSENESVVQVAKTMDSLDTKIQKVKNSLQESYSSIGVEKVLKGALTGINNIIQSFNKMNKIQFFANIWNTIDMIKTGGTWIINKVLAMFRESLNKQLDFKAKVELDANKSISGLEDLANTIKESVKRGVTQGYSEGIRTTAAAGNQPAQTSNNAAAATPTTDPVMNRTDTPTVKDSIETPAEGAGAAIADSITAIAEAATPEVTQNNTVVVSENTHNEIENTTEDNIEQPVEPQVTQQAVPITGSAVTLEGGINLASAAINIESMTSNIVVPNGQVALTGGTQFNANGNTDIIGASTLNINGSTSLNVSNAALSVDSATLNINGAITAGKVVVMGNTENKSPSSAPTPPQTPPTQPPAAPQAPVQQLVTPVQPAASEPPTVSDSAKSPDIQSDVGQKVEDAVISAEQSAIDRLNAVKNMTESGMKSSNIGDFQKLEEVKLLTKNIYEDYLKKMLMSMLTDNPSLASLGFSGKGIGGKTAGGMFRKILPSSIKNNPNFIEDFKAGKISYDQIDEKDYPNLMKMVLGNKYTLDNAIFRPTIGGKSIPKAVIDDASANLSDPKNIENISLMLSIAKRAELSGSQTSSGLSSGIIGAFDSIVKSLNANPNLSKSDDVAVAAQMKASDAKSVDDVENSAEYQEQLNRMGEISEQPGDIFKKIDPNISNIFSGILNEYMGRFIAAAAFNKEPNIEPNEGIKSHLSVTGTKEDFMPIVEQIKLDMAEGYDGDASLTSATMLYDLVKAGKISGTGIPTTAEQELIERQRQEQALENTGGLTGASGIANSILNSIQPKDMEVKGEEAGSSYADGAEKGLNSGVGKINSSGVAAGNAMNKGFESGSGVSSPSWKAEQAAQFYIQGAENGLSSGMGKLNSLGVQAGTQLDKGFKDGLGTHSPSWKAEKAANDYGDGVTEAIPYVLGKCNTFGERMGNALDESFKASLDESEIMTGGEGAIEEINRLRGGLGVLDTGSNGFAFLQALKMMRIGNGTKEIMTEDDIRNRQTIRRLPFGELSAFVNEIYTDEPTDDENTGILTNVRTRVLGGEPIYGRLSAPIDMTRIDQDAAEKILPINYSALGLGPGSEELMDFRKFDEQGYDLEYATKFREAFANIVDPSSMNTKTLAMYDFMTPIVNASPEELGSFFRAEYDKTGQIYSSVSDGAGMILEAIHLAITAVKSDPTLLTDLLSVATRHYRRPENVIDYKTPTVENKSYDPRSWLASLPEDSWPSVRHKLIPTEAMTMWTNAFNEAKVPFSASLLSKGGSNAALSGMYDLNLRQWEEHPNEDGNAERLKEYRMIEATQGGLAAKQKFLDEKVYYKRYLTNPVAEIGAATRNLLSGVTLSRTNGVSQYGSVQLSSNMPSVVEGTMTAKEAITIFSDRMTNSEKEIFLNTDKFDADRIARARSSSFGDVVLRKSDPITLDKLIDYSYNPSAYPYDTTNVAVMRNLFSNQRIPSIIDSITNSLSTGGKDITGETVVDAFANALNNGKGTTASTMALATDFARLTGANFESYADRLKSGEDVSSVFSSDFIDMLKSYFSAPFSPDFMSKYMASKKSEMTGDFNDFRVIPVNQDAEYVPESERRSKYPEIFERSGLYYNNITAWTIGGQNNKNGRIAGELASYPEMPRRTLISSQYGFKESRDRYNAYLSEQYWNAREASFRDSGGGAFVGELEFNDRIKKHVPRVNPDGTPALRFIPNFYEGTTDAEIQENFKKWKSTPLAFFRGFKGIPRFGVEPDIENNYDAMRKSGASFLGYSTEMDTARGFSGAGDQSRIEVIVLTPDKFFGSGVSEVSTESERMLSLDEVEILRSAYANSGISHVFGEPGAVNSKEVYSLAGSVPSGANSTYEQPVRSLAVGYLDTLESTRKAILSSTPLPSTFGSSTISSSSSVSSPTPTVSLDSVPLTKDLYDSPYVETTNDGITALIDGVAGVLKLTDGIEIGSYDTVDEIFDKGFDMLSKNQETIESITTNEGFSESEANQIAYGGYSEYPMYQLAAVEAVKKLALLYGSEIFDAGGGNDNIGEMKSYTYDEVTNGYTSLKSLAAADYLEQLENFASYLNNTTSFTPNSTEELLKHGVEVFFVREGFESEENVEKYINENPFINAFTSKGLAENAASITGGEVSSKFVPVQSFVGAYKDFDFNKGGGIVLSTPGINEYDRVYREFMGDSDVDDIAFDAATYPSLKIPDSLEAISFFSDNFSSNPTLENALANSIDMLRACYGSTNDGSTVNLHGITDSLEPDIVDSIKLSKGSGNFDSIFDYIFSNGIIDKVLSEFNLDPNLDISSDSMQISLSLNNIFTKLINGILSDVLTFGSGFFDSVPDASSLGVFPDPDFKGDLIHNIVNSSLPPAGIPIPTSLNNYELTDTVKFIKKMPEDMIPQNFEQLFNGFVGNDLRKDFANMGVDLPGSIDKTGLTLDSLDSPDKILDRIYSSVFEMIPGLNQDLAYGGAKKMFDMSSRTPEDLIATGTLAYNLSNASGPEYLNDSLSLISSGLKSRNDVSSIVRILSTFSSTAGGAEALVGNEERLTSKIGTYTSYSGINFKQMYAAIVKEIIAGISYNMDPTQVAGKEELVGKLSNYGVAFQSKITTKQISPDLFEPAEPLAYDIKQLTSALLFFSSLSNQINTGNFEYSKFEQEKLEGIDGSIEVPEAEVLTPDEILDPMDGSGLKEKSKAIGGYVDEGLAVGVNEGIPEAHGAGVKAGSEVVEGVAEGATVQSPSRKAIEIGKFITEGLKIGVLDGGLDNIVNAIKAMMEEAGSDARETLEKKFTEAGSSLDMNNVRSALIEDAGLGEKGEILPSVLNAATAKGSVEGRRAVLSAVNAATGYKVVTGQDISEIQKARETDKNNSEYLPVAEEVRDARKQNIYKSKIVENAKAESIEATKRAKGVESTNLYRDFMEAGYSGEEASKKIDQYIKEGDAGKRQGILQEMLNRPAENADLLGALQSFAIPEENRKAAMRAFRAGKEEFDKGDFGASYEDVQEKQKQIENDRKGREDIISGKKNEEIEKNAEQLYLEGLKKDIPNIKGKKKKQKEGLLNGIDNKDESAIAKTERWLGLSEEDIAQRKTAARNASFDAFVERNGLTEEEAAIARASFDSGTVEQGESTEDKAVKMDEAILEAGDVAIDGKKVKANDTSGGAMAELYKYQESLSKKQAQLAEKFDEAATDKEKEVYSGELNRISSLLSEIQNRMSAIAKEAEAAGDETMRENDENLPNGLNNEKNDDLLDNLEKAEEEIDKLLEESEGGDEDEGKEDKEDAKDKARKRYSNNGYLYSMLGSSIASVLNLLPDADSKATVNAKGMGTVATNMMSAVGAGSQAVSAFMSGNYVGAALNGLRAAMNVIGGIKGIADNIYNFNERMANMEKDLETKKQTTQTKTSEAKNLQTTIDKLESLRDARNESNEAYEEYISYMNEISSTYPDLVSAYDAEGNAIISLNSAYQQLAQNRLDATAAGKESAELAYDIAKERKDRYDQSKEQISGILSNNIIDAGIYNGTVQGNNSISSATVSQERTIAVSIDTTDDEGWRGTFQSDLQDALFWLEDSGVESGLVEVNGHVYDYEKLKEIVDNNDNFTYDKNVSASTEAAEGIIGDAYVDGTRINDYLTAIYGADDGIVTLEEFFDSGIATDEAAQQYSDTIKQAIIASGIDEDTVNNMADWDNMDIETLKRIIKIFDSREDFLTSSKETSERSLGQYYASNYAAQQLVVNPYDDFAQAVSTDTNLQNLIFSKAKADSGDADFNEFLETNDVGTQYEAIKKVYDALSSSGKKDFTSILAEAGKYKNADDFYKAFSEKGIQIDEKDAKALWEDSNKASLRQAQEMTLAGKTRYSRYGTGVSGVFDDIITSDDEGKASWNMPPEYADVYLSQIEQGTDLIDAGLFTLGEKRVEQLQSLWSNIGNMEDDKAQSEVYELLKSADLTSFEGIEKLVKNLEDLAREKGYDVSGVIGQVNRLKESVNTNINTMIENAITAYGNAFTSASNAASGATSGLSVDDAKTAYSSIRNSGIAGYSDLSYTDLFRYDEASKKMVYTTTGYEAINAVNQGLMDKEYADEQSSYDETIKGYKKLRFLDAHGTFVTGKQMTESRRKKIAQNAYGERYNGNLSKTLDQSQIRTYATGENLTDDQLKEAIGYKEGEDYDRNVAIAKFNKLNKKDRNNFITSNNIYGAINYDSEEVQKLLAPLGITDTSEMDDITKQIVEKALANATTANEFYENFVQGYYDAVTGKEDSTQLHKAFEAANKRIQQATIYSSIDFGKLTSGELSKTEITTLKENLVKYSGDTMTKIDSAVAAIQKGGADALAQYSSLIEAEDFDTSTARSIYEAAGNNFVNGITELVGSKAGELLDASTVSLLDSIGFEDADGLLEKVGTEDNPIYKIQDSGEKLVTAAQKVYESISQNFDDASITVSQLNSAFVSVMQASFADDTAFASVLSSSSNVDLTSLQTLADAMNIKLENWIDLETGEVNAAMSGLSSKGNGKYEISNWDEFIGQIDIEINKKASDIIDAYASYLNNQAKTSKQSAMNSIGSNLSSISIDAIATLAKSLGLSYEIFKDANAFLDNGNGTYSMSESTFIGLINGYEIELNNELKDTITSLIENNFSSAESAISKSLSGASASDMISQINTMMKAGIDVGYEDISYDSELNTFMLSSNAAKAAREQYISNLTMELQKLDMTNDKISEILEGVIDSAISSAANEVDYSSFLTSSNSYSDYKTIKKSLDTLADTARAYGQGVSENFSTNIIDMLSAGGERAVLAIKELSKYQDKTLTTEDYKNAYKSKALSLQNISEELSSGINDVVSGQAASILQAAGYQFKNLGTDGNLITSIGDLGEAYRLYYERLRETNQANINEINEAASNWITNSQNQETSAMSILTSASGFGIDSLATFGNAFNFDIGKMFDANGDITGGWQSIIKYAGNGSYQISDWGAFVSQIEKINGEIIDKSSKEYLDAYSSWVDSQISDSTFKADNLETAVQNIASAKNRDKLNLTALEQVYGDEIFDVLKGYGIQYSNGIGEIISMNAADISGLITDLESRAGGNEELKSAVNELKDTLLDTLNGYADTLAKALSGDIGYYDAQSLADAFNLNMDRDFTATGKGLQISEEAVARIYREMKDIDQLAANIVLENIIADADSLGNGIKNASELAREMRTTQVAMANLGNSSELTATAEQARLNTLTKTTYELNQQLELYQDMQAAMLDMPDSWKLADEELSKPIQSALNAWESAGKWMDALNKASSSGDTKNMLGVQDFTNMVNFVAENVAGAAEDFMGTEMTASQMIQKGYSALKNVDGNTYVDLSKLGVNFLSGSEDMASNIKTGINNLAQSQVDMLDGIIAMLEVIVAMEALGDIDLDKSGTLDMDEIFEGWTEGWSNGSRKMEDLVNDTENFKGFTKGYNNAVEAIREKLTDANGKETELGKAMKKMTINGKSMSDMLLNNDFAGTGITADAWGKTVNSLYQMAISGDYDEDALVTSFTNEMAKAGLNDTITIELDENKKVFIKDGGVYTVDYESETFQDRLRDAFEKGKKDSIKKKEQEQAQEIIEEYYNNGAENLKLEDLNKALILSGDVVVVVDDNENVTYKLSDGTTYSKEDWENGKAAVDALILGSAGDSSDEHVEKTSDGKITKKEVKKTLTSGFSYDLTIEGDPENGYKTTYTYEGDTYDSYQEMVQGAITKAIEDVKKEGGPENEKLQGKDLEKLHGAELTAEIEYALGLKVRPTLTLSSAIGGKMDISDQIADWLKLGQMTPDEVYDAAIGQIKDALAGGSQAGDVIDIEINGVKVKFTIPDVNTTDENTDEVAAQVGEQLVSDVQNGVESNTSIITQIAEGISAAFTSMGVGDAIGTAIRDGIVKALTTTTNENGETIPVPLDLSSLTIQIGENGQVTVTDAAGSLQSKIQQEIQKLLTGMTFDPFEVTIQITPVLGSTTPTPQTDSPLYKGGYNYDDGGSGITGLKITTDKVEAEGATIDAGGSTVNLDSIETTTSSVTINTPVVNIGGTNGGNGGSGGGNNGGTNSSKAGGASASLDSKNNSGSSKSAVDKFSKVDTTQMTQSVTNAATQSGNSISNSITSAATKGSSAWKTMMDGIKSKNVTVNVNYPKSVSISASMTLSVDVGVTGAKGSYIKSVGGPDCRRSGLSASFSKDVTAAKGNFGKAMVGGSTRTLMGELGPELVVSGGRFFTVGNSGPEFVDLANDAIVFNHLQTKQLKERGRTPHYGRPFKNEREAVSFAKGNTSGPAKASAAAALAAMKELRAMWASLAGASAKDLGRKSGGGGGGGGGGGEEAKNYMADLDRWYNLLKQIDTISAELTTHEKARSVYINAMVNDGDRYVKSLEQSTKLIEAQLDKYVQIRNLTRDYYDLRVKDLQNSAYGQIVEVLSDGTVQYKNEGFKLLAKLNETKGAQGVAAKYTSAEQLKMIQEAGFDLSLLEYKSDGTKTETDDDKLQVFWDEIDGWTAELEEMYSSIEDYDQQIEDLVKDLEDLAEEVRTKIVDLKTKLAEAIENKLQTAIDDLQDQVDEMSKASEQYIDGLSKALEKEKSMYENQKSNQELISLQRQLAILQRTGGAASEIKSLQDQINSQLQTNYFDEQQSEIDKLQEAVDAQKEALEKQIEIMTESLEYQKENGLFFDQVNEMISEAIREGENDWMKLVDFIASTNPDYASMSAEELAAELYTGSDSIGILIQEALGYIEDDTYSTLTQSIQSHTASISDSTSNISDSVADIERLLMAAEEDPGSASSLDTSKTWKDAYNMAMAAGKSAEEASRYATAVEQGKLGSDATQLISDIAAGGRSENFAAQIGDKYGTKGVDALNRQTYLNRLLNGSSEQKYIDDAKTKLRGLINDKSFTDEEARQVQEIIDLYDKYHTSGTSSTVGLLSLLDDASDSNDEYNKQASYTWTVKADGNNIPYSTSAFSDSAKTKWRNERNSEVTNNIPSGTPMTFTQFGGSGSISRGYAQWKDPKGNVRYSYIELSSNQQSELKKYATLEERLNTSSLPHFLHGGLVDFTGPAWMDGTSSKPEAILSNSDYELLKKNILNSSNTGLAATLESIALATESMVNSSSNIGEGNRGVVFENVNLNIESGVISSDYDAQKAGQSIMEEMMKIARKSGNISITRR